MDINVEPFVTNAWATQLGENEQETYDSLIALQGQAVSRLRTYGICAVVLLTIGLLGVGALAKVLIVLAAIMAFFALAAVVVREKYDALINLVGMHRAVRPMYSGEDWLAYHLAQRLETDGPEIPEQADDLAPDAVRP